jgi:ornithine decarboxylase
LDVLQQAGGKFEICSGRELDAALRIGARPDELIHTHPVKSLPEFDYAVSKGIDTFVVDNFEEVRKLERYRDRQLNILIRFRINNNTKAVVDLQYKFGCATREVLPLARAIAAAGHRVYGLSFHIGSQCIYPQNYVKAIRKAAELMRTMAAEGYRAEMLDIGGGFPVEYVEPVPVIEDFCVPINRALKRHIPSGVKLVCEPGRFISASPVTLVCTVIGKALRNGKVWYYLDDGLYSTFSGILYDHCQYPVITGHEGRERLSVLAGPTCDSFDVMYDGLMIPDHRVGDKFIFPLTGAYCAVSGSDFNSLKRPDYVVID